MCQRTFASSASAGAELSRLADEYGLKVSHQSVDLERAPLLISLSDFSRQGLRCFGFWCELKDWLAAANTIAFQMQASHARFYLPKDTETSKAVAVWEKLRGRCTAEFIEDHQEHA